MEWGNGPDHRKPTCAEGSRNECSYTPSTSNVLVACRLTSLAKPVAHEQLNVKHRSQWTEIYTARWYDAYWGDLTKFDKWKGLFVSFLFVIPWVCFLLIIRDA